MDLPSPETLVPGYNVGNFIGDPLTVGLVESIIKKWLDKQIRYIMNNLTHFNVSIWFPQFSQLLQNYNNLKTSLIRLKELKKDAEKTYAQVGEAIKKINAGEINPFEVLKDWFERVTFLNIKTKAVVVQVPYISKEQLNEFETKLKAWIVLMEDLVQNREDRVEKAKEWAKQQ